MTTEAPHDNARIETASLAPPAAAAVPRRAFTNIAWSFAGTLAFSLAQWIVIVVLARVGNPAIVGQYALGLAISAPVILFASLALRTVYVTDGGRQFVFRDYLVLRALCMVAAVAAIGGVAQIVGTEHVVVIALVAMAKALDGVGDIFHALFQRHEQMRTIAISLMINGAVTVVATITLYALTGRAIWAIAGSVLGSALGAIVYCVRSAGPLMAGVRRSAAAATHRGTASFVRRNSNLVTISLPLGLASAVASLSANLPRYFVGYWLGVSALGTFAALGYVVLAANTISLSVAQTMLPRMTRLYLSGQSGALWTLTKRLTLGSLALGAVATALSPVIGGPVLGLLYGAAYAREVGLLTIFLIVAGISGAVFFVGTALSATRAFRNQLASSSLTLVLTGVVGWLVVPRYGVIGAAWLIVLAMSTDGVIKATMLRRSLNARSAT